MTGKALVCGGSIGGLFAAAALRRAGWQVEVFERTGVELSGRGAGIVTHDVLVAALRAVGVDVADLGVAVEDRVTWDLAGREVGRLRLPQVVTSWDRIHRGLRALMPEGTHHLGRAVAGYAQDADGVMLHFADGRAARGDVLVGADGFRSAIRGQMLPEVQPVYSGYVVWRTLAHEADLPVQVREEVFPHFGFHLPTGGEFIGYPIAGPENDLRPGHRRYNFVWYVPVEPRALRDMLTDGEGVLHSVSIPPPLVREDVVSAMMADAEARLARPFVEILRVAERPFFTPIYDHVSPVMAEGRVALTGDAACVARPHVGMGVTKAACDALALARHLAGAGDVAAALAAYSAERVPEAEKAWSRSRRLGAYLFDDPPGGNADGANNRHQEEIMRDTAVMVE